MYMYMPTNTHTEEVLNLKISYPGIMQAAHVALTFATQVELEDFV